MPSLFLAFLILLAAAGALFSVLRLLGVSSDFAGSVATSLFGGISYVHQYLERRDLLADLVAGSAGSDDLRGYSLPVGTLITYGTLALVALTNAASAAAGVLARLSEAKKPLLLFLSIELFAVAIGCYLIGRWIARRAGRHGLAAVVLVCLLARLVTSVVDAVWAPDVLRTAFRTTGLSTTPFQFFAVQVAGGAAIQSMFAAAGWLRGRRQREAAYLVHLLAQLPPMTRVDVISLVREEAQRVVGAADPR
jgi:hypothetical protein